MPYHGAPDWQFLSRFCSTDVEELGWPFSVGDMVAATNSHDCCWLPYRCPVDPGYVIPTHQNFAVCALSLDFLARGGLEKARKAVSSLIEQSRSVIWQAPDWEPFELDMDFFELGGIKYRTSIIKKFPRIRSVGISTVNCLVGTTQGMFIRWGHNGSGLILPHEEPRLTQ